ncbi:dual specificity protein phosphatase 22-B isoform X1 [Gasterosteus aculeatus]
MGNGINKVLPDLYLGNFRDARDREQLARHNITHILSIHDSAAPILQEGRTGATNLHNNFVCSSTNKSPLCVHHQKRTLGLLLISGPLTGNWWHFVPQEMTYLCISAADLPSQNLTQHFKQSITFMHESRLKGEGCLVHCLAGVSRSVTLVLAYIMTVTRLGWQEALAAVRVVRPCAGPNLGFQRQLQEFEATQADQFREWLQKEYKDNSFSDEADLRDLLAAASKVNGDGVEKQESTPPGDL